MDHSRLVLLSSCDFNSALSCRPVHQVVYTLIGHEKVLMLLELHQHLFCVSREEHHCPMCLSVYMCMRVCQGRLLVQHKAVALPQ